MKTRVRAATPLPQHGARGDNYSLSDSHISMKNAYSWDSKHLIKRLTLPHSCLCLQKGECFRQQWQRQTTFPFSCCFVWVFSTWSWPAAGPRALFTQSKLSIKKQASCCLCRALYIISWGAIWVQLHWKTSCIYIYIYYVAYSIWAKHQRQQTNMLDAPFELLHFFYIFVSKFIHFQPSRELKQANFIFRQIINRILYSRHCAW